MVPLSMQGALRDLDLLLERGTEFHSGPCARDLQQPVDIRYALPSKGHIIKKAVSDFNARTVEEILVERYAIGVDGEMAVLRGNQEAPLSFSVPRGYHFDI
jgi:hypothetical protein